MSGYTNWKKALHNFEKHSNCKSHNNARMNYDDFMNQRTSVSTKIVDTSKEEEIRYKIRLTSSLEVARFLIEQGDAFRGHDEFESSMNRGKFREMVEWYKNKKKSVKDACEKGCKRNQMLSHHIQKDLTKACAQQVTKVILEELGDKNFSILLDESRDISIKEKMALILRFVNDQGKVVERLLGVQHIGSCTAIALKEALDMRENRWEPLFKRVQSFCDKNEIKVPKMDKEINAKGTYSRKRQKVTNKHFYHIDIFTAAIDSISIEMNHRFNEISSELLVCMAALNSRNNFSNFDVEKLVRLAEIYAEDFTIADCLVLRNQLQSFILNIRRSREFVGCKDLPNFAEKMVETGKSRSFPLVYRLIELILILPVAIASVERVFSAINHIKTDLRNKMGDEWLNDLMICYSEKEIFRSISNEKIIQEFEDMKKRHMLVPKNKSVIVTHED